MFSVAGITQLLKPYSIRRGILNVLNEVHVIVTGNMDAVFMNCGRSPHKIHEVEVEVQIIDLQDVYDKKTKRTPEGLEYRLEDSKVTVVVHASEEITCVRAYTQRCPEAAIRTHDTIGRHWFRLSLFYKNV